MPVCSDRSNAPKRDEPAAVRRSLVSRHLILFFFFRSVSSDVLFREPRFLRFFRAERRSRHLQDGKSRSYFFRRRNADKTGDDVLRRGGEPNRETNRLDSVGNWLSKGTANKRALILRLTVMKRPR